MNASDIVEKVWGLLPNFGGLNAGIVAVLMVLAAFSAVYAALKRYQRCPADKILVISGRTGAGGDGKTRQARCVHGGGAIVWPIIQEYQFLSLVPFTVPVDLKDALTQQNIRVSIPSSFTIGISTMPGVMENAAQRLLGLPQMTVKGIAEEIIIGQLRSVLASMTIEQINTDREAFMTKCATAIGSELNKVGLHLINVNIKDIVDESGYIKALGQKAAATAVQTARREVADQEAHGGIGVAEAQRNQRVKTAEANAAMVAGENAAAIDVAKSNSDRAIAEAEAHRAAEAARRIADAKVTEQAYLAQVAAERARAEKERAEQVAIEVVKAEVERQARVVEAEGEAQATVIKAEAEAKSVLLRLTAEADGAKVQLLAQAEGIKRIVEAAGGKPEAALGLLIQRQLPELFETYTRAVEGIHVDKVVIVGNGGTDGTGVDTYVRSLFHSVPGMDEVLRAVGMKLPQWLAEGAPASALNGSGKPVTEPAQTS